MVVVWHIKSFYYNAWINMIMNNLGTTHTYTHKHTYKHPHTHKFSLYNLANYIKCVKKIHFNIHEILTQENIEIFYDKKYKVFFFDIL